MTNKSDYLARARERYKKLYGNTAGIKVFEHKLYKTLHLVNTFRYSTPSLIDFYVQNYKRGFAKKLLKQGYFVEHEIYSSVPYLPRKVLTLSKKAKEELLSKFGYKLKIWEGKINVNTLLHNYTVQAITIALIKKREKTKLQASFIGEVHTRSVFHKDYDAVLLQENIKTGENLNAGIELDLNYKKPKEIEKILDKFQKDLKENLVKHIFIYFPEAHFEKLKNQYLKAIHKKYKIKALKDPLIESIKFSKIPIPFRPYLSNYHKI